MSAQETRILIVDDEELNVEILVEYLEDEGYMCCIARDGEEGWQKLLQEPRFNVILLDRMMPKLNGMELLKRIKAEERFRDIPVVMETAVAASRDVAEGINQGAYYYLTKPFSREMLTTIVRSAYNDYRLYEEMRGEREVNNAALCLLQLGRFEFKTIPEAEALGRFVAAYTPEPYKVVGGITELLVNAVEHGNLNIAYREKASLMLKNQLAEEIERRLSMDEYGKKIATLMLKVEDEHLVLRIQDEGQGFDYQKFLDMDVARAEDPNGRGIAIARKCIEHIEYLGCGNEVLCRLPLSASLFARRQRLVKQ